MNILYLTIKGIGLFPKHDLKEAKGDRPAKYTTPQSARDTAGPHKEDILMAKEVKKIGLNELELTNDDIFVRKSVNGFEKDDVVIVHETHSAMLLKDGKLQDTLEAGRYPLFELSKKFFGLVKEKTDTDVELIYVSKTAELLVRWGTPTQFTFRDPVTDYAVRVGASGEFGVKVKDPVQLYKVLIGAKQEFSIDDLRTRLRGRMLNEIEPAIAKAMREKQLSYTEFTEHKQEIAGDIKPPLGKLFEMSYGLEITYFIISNVVINPEDAAKIEAELDRRKQEKKAKEQKEAEREDYKWWVAEYERVKDKEFGREMLMRELESKDKEKYLEVCKIVGWNGNGGVSGKSFCPNCGHEYPAGARFCGNCGKPVGVWKVQCPHCGAENPSTNKFCGSCGKQIN